MSPVGTLPRADEAIVPRDKLEGYCLNPEHETGKHKARAFISTLGIAQGDWEYLRDQLDQHRQALLDASLPKPA